MSKVVGQRPADVRFPALTRVGGTSAVNPDPAIPPARGFRAL